MKVHGTLYMSDYLYYAKLFHLENGEQITQVEKLFAPYVGKEVEITVRLRNRRGEP